MAAVILVNLTLRAGSCPGRSMAWNLLGDVDRLVGRATNISDFVRVWLFAVGFMGRVSGGRAAGLARHRAGAGGLILDQVFVTWLVRLGRL